ncbi:hypothetical protein IU438_07445 [Nocardia cyriacigeorgica]|uniref:hypothetical protein n=1 Tax=Nocardia cyriacigeorgica TaxID=135487 RepID=UPI0018938F7A|nr:hypothetical protein [Nocardia cyriacigeorgica]MBF6086910.1 hypothetical protein [Nocardia cyriacigeorgica]MBF6395622.1 hypothetical protein [Nocardia cyriacigeorgica]MBF6401254.1 hypothetical protein [Nocardia cyriacigeorgica]
MSKPQWGSMREPDIDPAVEAIARKVMEAVDNLRTATIRLAALDVEQLFDGPTEVTEEFISIVAGMDTASPALKEYAERVANGECRWRDIETLANPVPPEVAEMKNSPQFTWMWTPEPPQTPTPPPTPTWPSPQTPIRRPRAGETVVGPSDWPDDFDEYPGEQRWR